MRKAEVRKAIESVGGFSARTLHGWVRAGSLWGATVADAAMKRTGSMNDLTEPPIHPLVRLLGVGLVVDGIRRISRRSARKLGPGAWMALGLLEVGFGLNMLERAAITPRTLYRVVAQVYDPIMPLWRDWLYRDATRAFDDALRTWCRPGSHVLDLACGTGAVLERLLAIGAPLAWYTGVDQSAPMLDRARAKFGAMPNAAFDPLDLRSGPLPAGPYDLIASAWALEHLPDPGQVIASAAERLRPGGVLVLLFEADGNSWRERSLRRVWRFLAVRLIPEREYVAWPGVTSIQRFGAAGPSAVVLIAAPTTST